MRNNQDEGIPVNVNGGYLLETHWSILCFAMLPYLSCTVCLGIHSSSCSLIILTPAITNCCQLWCQQTASSLHIEHGEKYSPSCHCGMFDKRLFVTPSWPFPQHLNLFSTQYVVLRKKCYHWIQIVRMFLRDIYFPDVTIPFPTTTTSKLTHYNHVISHMLELIQEQISADM